MKRSRPIAVFALLAMAFAALLPFTAAARMLFSDGPTEHCHKLSIDSAMYPDPTAPEGPSQPRKATCPFCASAVVAPPASPPPLPTFVRLDAGFVAPEPRVAVVIAEEPRRPPARAPPSVPSPR